MLVSSPVTTSVTFLFTDVEGSTRLWESFPEAMGAAVARHEAIIGQAVEAQGGRVFKTMGDAVFAAFESGTAAVFAALEAQLALLEEPWPFPGSLRVRMAIHAGHCEARDGDYFGRPLNRTARLLAIGHGGQILVSGRVRDVIEAALPDGATLIPLGEHRLRDLTRPEQVFGLLHPSLPPVFPPLRSAGRLDVPHNLPEPTTTFIGREAELSTIEALLSRTRLLTLTGSGGCGKTRLAFQIASEAGDGFRDGVWLVELAAMADPSLVPSVVAQILGLEESPADSPEVALARYARGRELLLVLDNCEHVLDACRSLVDALLRAAPGVKVLATSREGLDISGELVFRVPSLTLPGEGARRPEELLACEAPRLFLERAQFHRPDFTLTGENAETLGRLCRRLDGIPLAIELAAARVRSLSLGQIEDRLDDCFRLLTGGSRAALPRQQTLRALVDWSYGLLSDPERIALRRLGVFRGGCTVETAEAILPDSKLEAYEVLDLLASLVDKSLIHTEEKGQETRYRLLETVRQYALERLDEAGETEALRQRHLNLFLELAETAQAHLAGADQVAWLERLGREHDNLRAAIERAAGDAKLRLCGALYWFWHVKRFNAEGLRRLIDALSDPVSATPSPAHAKVLLGAGTLAYWLEDERHRDFFERALASAESIGDQALVARILGNMGATSVESREFLKAREYIARALQINQTLNLPARMAHQYCTLGFIEREQGNPMEARNNLREALNLSRTAGHRYLEAYSLMAAGTVAVAYQQEDAFDLLREAVKTASDSDNGPVMAAALAWTAEAERLAKRFPAAEQAISEARKAAPEKDRILYEVDLIQTRLNLELGQRREAKESLEGVLNAALRQSVAIDGIEVAAAVLHAEGHFKAAAVLLGAAQCLRDRCGMPILPIYALDLARLTIALREALDEPGKAFTRGSQMDARDAIRYARVCLE